MSWRSLIPFAGKKPVRKKLKELDNKFVSIMVLIGIGFSKIFESWINVMAETWPIVLWGVDISKPVWWKVWTFGWVIVFLYEVNEKAKEAASSAADKAEDIAEEASEKVEETVEEK